MSEKIWHFVAKLAIAEIMMDLEMQLKTYREILSFQSLPAAYRYGLVRELEIAGRGDIEEAAP